jgi:hypothetical protein
LGRERRPRDPAYIKRAFLLGFPVSIEMSARALGLVVMSLLVTGFGTNILAAYGVGSNILQVVSIPAMGLRVGRPYPFLSEPPLIALAVAFFAISIVSLFAGGGVSPGIREDRGNRWVLIPFLVLGLANGFLPAWTDRIGFRALDGDLVRWIGVTL